MITNELLSAGSVIREPVGREQGYWVGAPGAFYAADEGAWYLTYRIRRPRGVQPDRGGEVRIARSKDLRAWDDVLTIAKDRYDSASIERSCLHRGPDRQWRYFTSYVHPEDGKWCTAVMKAGAVKDLDPQQRTVIFKGSTYGLEGVKDPWLLEHQGIYYLFLSVATPVAVTSDQSHATLDIFNTGECKSATALAVSRDLERWEWKGVVLAPPAEGWDKYCRRMNSVVPLPNGMFLGFYDGSASHAENYEERCALAISKDLVAWQTLSPRGPALTSPHASASLRYVDAQRAHGAWYLFYEYALASGAHDMRMVTCTAADLAALAQR